MHFLAPWWWLLVFPLAGAIVLLYLLKMRRRDVVVPSVYLWQQALHDLQANAPLQKLRTHLLLLLQLLTVLILVFALARPALMAGGRLGRQYVLILDRSASMQSTDVSPSRFLAARRAAHRWVERLGRHDALLLITIGGTTRMVTPFTGDQRVLHAALDRLQPCDAVADLSGAFDLVAGLLHRNPGNRRVRMIVLSDGALPRTPVPASLRCPIQYEPVGRRGHNAGFVTADVRWQPNAFCYEGLLRLKNAAPTPLTGTLSYTLDGTLRDARTLTLSAGGQHTETLRRIPAAGGLLRAEFAVADDLAVDNVVHLIVPPVAKTRVTLVAAENFFLETALKLDRGLVVNRAHALPATDATGAVWVIDNRPVAHLPAGCPALVIGPRALGAAIPGRRGGVAKGATVVEWDRTHPLLAHVDLSDLRLADAAVVMPAAGAHALIESDAGPVALAAEVGGQRLLYLGWDLRHSDFPLRPAFPIFISNAIAWLAGSEEREGQVNARTGRLVRLSLPAGTTQCTLTDPAGHQERLAVESASITLDRVMTAGVYTVTAGTQTHRFAANLLSPDESATAPRPELALAGRQGQHLVTRAPLPTESEWWRLLLLAALVLLGIEWWVYHRRV
jgi:Ca-activated chloride channel family protein